MNADQGLIYVVLEHFTRHLHPRAVEMARALDAGGCLSDEEIDHVLQVIEDARLLRPLLERHPEHRALAGAIIALYADIARRAWHNETTATSEPTRAGAHRP